MRKIEYLREHIMSYYKIGPVVIEMESAGAEFEPFHCQTEHAEPDVHVQFMQDPLTDENSELVTDRCNFRIKKYISDEGTPFWLFIHDNKIGKSILKVTGDYKYGFFYCPEEKSGPVYHQILAILMQPFISCVAVKKNLLVLHAACIYQGDTAVAFSGRSGIGKSTRASQWVLNAETRWLSGDRPWIDPERGMAIGTPWDGKEGISNNITVHLPAVFEVKRSKVTCLCTVPEKEAFDFLISQVYVPMWDPQLVARVFFNLRRLLKKVSFYQLFCDQSSQAAAETYAILKDKLHFELKELSSMRMKEAFEIIQIDNDYMAIPVGDNMDQFKGTVVLNEVSAFLLRHMKTDISQEELVQLLLKEYDVSAERAALDVKNIIAKFDEIGLLQ